MFDDTMINPKNVAKQTAHYVQYELPGYVNGVRGRYEVGVNKARNEIVHRFFRPAK
jgi:hypothetical protein